MASIKKIEGKGGVSYKITVSMGRDARDRQIRHYKTWKPDKPMTARQMEAVDFTIPKGWIRIHPPRVAAPLTEEQKQKRHRTGVEAGKPYKDIYTGLKEKLSAFA